MINLRGLFTRDAIIAYLVALPVLKTPVMDAVFTDRPQHPLALLGADDLAVDAQPLPLIRRGGPSIAAVSESGGIAMYEPLPVRTHKPLTAADLNNLAILKGESLDTWARGKTDYLRRAVRRTTEAMCARALSGTLRWPVALEKGGFDVLEVVYGQILSVEAEKAWNAADAKLKDVYTCLSDMEEAIQDGGFGGQVEIWAGKEAYNALFVIAENSKTTAQIRVEITSQGINVGGYLVKRRSEKQRDPESGAMVPAVPDDTVRMIALDAGHRLPYCAVDDLDANLQALPLFVKPVKTDDPSGYKLIAESKPFPVVNTRGVCDAVVL
ncbi:major capsid protein [Desulfovibrio sp. JY]|nr:major capsid protein [Desulfovibrio sp. JY]